LSAPEFFWDLTKTLLFVELSKEQSGKLGLFSSVVGHVGDGNFHQVVMYNPKDPAETAAVTKVVHDMLDRALEMEGTSSVSFLILGWNFYSHVVIGRTWNWLGQEGTSYLLLFFYSIMLTSRLPRTA
jgi:hypothetical protein